MSFMPALSQFIPFRNAAECARVRAITRDEIRSHPNPDFKIEVIEDDAAFYAAFATDIVWRIQQAAQEGRPCVFILPVGPVPQYAIATNMINRLAIPCHHVHTFNMDEYADENGKTAPTDWGGSFATAMRLNFHGLIAEDLRMPDSQIHFPNDQNIKGYSDLIAEATGGTGADCCYGGIGWCGHIAFWEADIGPREFGDDLESYLKAKARIVELHPMTIMQNALHSFGGDWSWVPPRAASIGPADIMGAKHRSFWLDGMCGKYTTMCWQRFIARLAAHCQPNTAVPGSILQLARTDYTILGGVADNVQIDMS